MAIEEEIEGDFGAAETPEKRAEDLDIEGEVDEGGTAEGWNERSG